MRTRDILFLNLHRLNQPNPALHGDFVGLYIMAAFLEDNGYEARVFAGGLSEGLKTISYEFGGFKVRAIGLYCDYENIDEVAEVSRFIKEKYNVPVFVGGPQSPALDQKFFQAAQCDVVVRGEGELTMLELLGYYLNGSGDLASIKGITYLAEDGKLTIQPEQDLIQNLDALPFVSAKHSLNSNFRNGNAAILTGRGCPFNCAFCYEGHHTKKVRLRSVDNVISEVKSILDNHKEVKYLLFTDDTFTLDTARIRALCEELAKLRAKHDFVWFCEGHVHTLHQHPQMLEYMVKAGLYRLQLGIEAGTDKVLSAYRKRTTAAEIKEVIKLCKEAGVTQVFGNIIVGGAHASEEVIAQDKKFIEDLLLLGEGMVELNTVFFWPLHGTSMTKNPHEYGLKIIDSEFLTSWGDLPLAEADGLSIWRQLELRQELNEHIRSVMCNMRDKSLISEKLLRTIFNAKCKYRSGGQWVQIIEEKAELYWYYNMLAQEALTDSNAFTPEALLNVRPQRMFELFSLLKITDGQYTIGTITLTRLHLELLRHATGKRCLCSVLKAVYQLFEQQYTDYNEFEQDALAALVFCEEQHWLAYAAH